MPKNHKKTTVMMSNSQFSILHLLSLIFHLLVKDEFRSARAGEKCRSQQHVRTPSIWSQTMGRLISLSWSNRTEFKYRLFLQECGKKKNHLMSEEGQPALMPNHDFPHIQLFIVFMKYKKL